MTYFAPRQCYEIAKDDRGDYIYKPEKPLASYRECPAYVLLGKPGSGKTTAFLSETERPDCKYVTARDLITFDIQDEWRDKTLFIDGLDEVRAGQVDARRPFDLIRAKLDQLGRPHFRLSCREADWYGDSDSEQLAKISENKNIKELFLTELSEEDIQQILVRNYQHQITDPTVFWEEVERRELVDLIKNPQVLSMLVAAVTDSGEWPQSKSETFKLACQRLVLTEQNRDHIDANRHRAMTIDTLMQSSGLLCALLLLARKYGFSQSRADADDDYPFIEDVDIDGTGVLALVSKTKLFYTHNGRIEYGHRILAEYLSAYYLAEKVLTQGLPIGRVLALMTGEDGIVVTELRGVYAWLTTLCHQERSMLLERDPLGVTLYGDVSLFTKDERLKLLYELSDYAEKAGELGLDYWNAQLFGSFCQVDMEQDYRAIFAATDRSRAQQLLLVYVLTSMTHGETLLDLSDALVSIIRDADWWPRNRRQALDILIQYNAIPILDRLLSEINDNMISDSDDDLLGTLIESFYPAYIPPTDIFGYLHLPKNPNYLGCYVHFWTHKLAELSSDEQIAQLLDTLVEKQEILTQNLGEIHYRTMMGELITKGLTAFGEVIETERLSAWLGLGLDEHGFISISNNNELELIRAWFNARPAVQKALIEYQLRKCRDSKNFGWCMHTLTERWFHAELPDDYGHWCLTKAKLSKSEVEARYLFMESVSTLYRGIGNAGLSLESLVDEAMKDTRLRRYWDEARVVKLDPEERKYKRENRIRKEKRRREKQEYLQFIRENLKEIKSGAARPGIFNDIGNAYFGHFHDSKGDTPIERLKNFFEHDVDLIQSVLVGLRRFVEREDIPSVTEIFQSNMNNKYFYFSRPYRAAMEEISQEEGEKILQLSEDKIDRALAFYFADGLGDETAWYKALLRDQPKHVAEIYVQYAGMALRTGKEHIIGIYALAYDKDHSEMARYAAVPLLSEIPARSTVKQLESLDFLLKAALQFADPGELRDVIEKKLKLKSMHVAQTIHWLAAGFILAPDEYSQRLTDYITMNQSRVKKLSSFLSYRGDQWSLEGTLPLAALAQLIELLGPYYKPYRLADTDSIGHAAMNSSELIGKFINQIAVNPTDEATYTLEDLLHQNKLTKWHSTLKNALHTQRAGKRESSFKHASMEQVCRTLKNAEPANVADLASLTIDHIRKLAYEIRHNSTSDYRQYWVRDKSKKMISRKHEEDIRDAFVSDLNKHLSSMNISAESESRYTNDNRADIKVSYGGGNGYHIPVEVKCNDSRDLWHAIYDQLIAQYTHDPGAHGYGIYLVFWFGNRYTTPHKAGGQKPKTAVELETRLVQLLSMDEERNKISVCVIDCTDPKENA